MMYINISNTLAIEDNVKTSFGSIEMEKQAQLGLISLIPTIFQGFPRKWFHPRA